MAELASGAGCAHDGPPKAVEVMMAQEDTAALDRAAKTQKALDRAADGAKAMAEYEAEKTAVDANTARLRALRLDKERAERDATEAAAKPKATGRKSRAKVSA